MIALAVVVYPLLEEFIFRALVHERLLKGAVMNSTALGVSVANVCVALMFGALHALTRTPVLGALVVIPALVIGFHYEDHRNNWWVAAFLHAWFNLIWLGYSAI